MTDAPLRALAEQTIALAARATERPWQVRPNTPGIIRSSYNVLAPGQLPVLQDQVARFLVMEDAAYIVHAANHVEQMATALLALLDVAEAARDLVYGARLPDRDGVNPGYHDMQEALKAIDELLADVLARLAEAGGG